MFAQLVGLFGTALFFASYQCRDNRQLFRVQFLSYLCYTAHLFLLGAATGAVSYLINTFRSFCLSSRYDFLRSRAMGAVICVLQILALVFTWSGWLSVLPVAATPLSRSECARECAPCTCARWSSWRQRWC